MQHLQLESGTTPGQYYQLDLINKTCTCAEGQAGNHCKHLDMVGVYKDKNWSQKTHPSFSQALSGLVKALRLRRIEDSVYWLTYLYGFKDQNSRFRLARRLLIGSAEDGHSIAVMERVAKNFPELCKLESPLICMVAEAMRICTVPNWWDPGTGGHDYIYTGMVANRQQWIYGEHGSKDTPFEEVQDRMIDAINDQDKIQTMGCLEAMVQHNLLGRTKIAEMLLDWATQMENEPAARLCRVHLSAKSALSGDMNFIGQAAWMLAGGYSPVVDEIGDVLVGHARQHMAAAQERWKNPELIPIWCCDGIHCGGTDRRFAGIWHDMYAACNAYEYYGTLNPDLGWQRQFFNLDGLHIKE